LCISYEALFPSFFLNITGRRRRRESRGEVASLKLSVTIFTPRATVKGRSAPLAKKVSMQPKTVKRKLSFVPSQASDSSDNLVDISSEDHVPFSKSYKSSIGRESEEERKYTHYDKFCNHIYTPPPPFFFNLSLFAKEK
jgi:hypothetical protein